MLVRSREEVGSKGTGGEIMRAKKDGNSKKEEVISSRNISRGT